MNKKLVLFYLALGMMSGGFYNDAFATNTVEQTAESQERVLTEGDAKKLIEEMKARGSTELVIPDGYTSVDDEAFRECTGLTSITLPKSIKSIGYRAFDGCEGLTSITIPDSVTYIGCGAFDGCSGLTSITIPDNVQSIGLSTFGRCSGLTSITIPNSVKSIGEYAFSGCSGLMSITIPDSVKSIGNGAFYKCNNKQLCFHVPSENMKNYLSEHLEIDEHNIYVDIASSGSAWWWDLDDNKHLDIPDRRQ